ncbi:MAG: anthranilate synthase component I family protein [Bacteroidota bacterium]
MMNPTTSPPPVTGKVLIRVRTRRMLADTVTPVSVYLKLRDHFGGAVLLESTDFRSKENCFSFIGVDPIANFTAQQNTVQQLLPGHELEVSQVADPAEVPRRLEQFVQRFSIAQDEQYGGINGFFGHTAFEAVQYFDTMRFDPAKRRSDLPELNYSLYRYVVAINHFKDELYLVENLPQGYESNLERIQDLVQSQQYGTYPFRLEGVESSNLTDEQFMELVRLGKRHCQLGDVFQIVFSRQFSQAFSGDEFNVYRLLRSINPSPYLFFFDYGTYKIFGSSPEAQMVIKGDVASVNPIAGTYRRSGDDEEDSRKAQELVRDPKENAEHIMLVDLARNDLGKHAEEVTVKELKEIQFFSHVIHLVSKVEGKLGPDTSSIQVFGDTFPAGTLSGAPKYKAIELIGEYENQNRGFYGGAIGYLGFDGEMNQAIVIRSFLSQNNHLYYQAGAGIVAASDELKELQEVNNKLGALTKALQEAQDI